MSTTLIVLLIVIIMFGFMIAGMEIAIAMGMTSAFALIFVVDKPIDQLASAAFEVMNSFTLTAVPLFVFMGAIFFNTGVVKSLFTAIDKLVSGLPGGIGHSVIAANAVFGAMSGSSVAATALFGKTCYPNMKELGYMDDLSLGTLVAGGTLAVLVPPSLILIIYGGWENVSVARLFAAGMIPGFMLTCLFMLTIIIRVKLNPSLAPKSINYSLKERLASLKDIFPYLILIFIILGAIFGGAMTPTEAAAAGAILSVVLAVIYRQMTFKAFVDSLKTAVNITAMVAFLLISARVLGQVFQYTGLIDMASGIFLSLPGGKYTTITVIFLMYIILGFFFDSLSMMVLTLPFISPVVGELGFSPIWFGVVYVVVAEIGLLTPPFGLNLFVLQGVTGKSISAIVRSTLPFFIPLFLMIFLLTIFPQLALWLPGVMY
ncbi:MAG: TRAP transporter large permease [Desulfobulbaceae bacterium]|nr:TRAP transporter large permease [Desulfobulbaceae bacterium]